MINTEVSQQNLNINFKLKLVKKDISNKLSSVKGAGLWQQMRVGNTVTYNKLDLKDIEKVMNELFYGKKQS